MRNNNPFDELYYAKKSHQERFSLASLIFAIAMVFLSLIFWFSLMRCEWFVHYFVHVPCMSLRDPRNIALNDDTRDDCTRCREVKQRVITQLLTPEERQIIRARDEHNIVAAKEAAESAIRFQEELIVRRKEDQERRWKRDLGL